MGRRLRPGRPAATPARSARGPRADWRHQTHCPSVRARPGSCGAVRSCRAGREVGTAPFSPAGPVQSRKRHRTPPGRRCAQPRRLRVDIPSVPACTGPGPFGFGRECRKTEQADGTPSHEVVEGGTMRCLPVDAEIGPSDQNDGVGPWVERRCGWVGPVGKWAGRSGPPEPAGGWTPTAGPELRAGPNRGPARRRPAGGSRGSREAGAAFQVIHRCLGPSAAGTVPIKAYKMGPTLTSRSDPDIP